MLSIQEAMSQSNNIHLPDLPDELIMAIFNKLEPADLLWSIMDVNKQLDKISCHRHFTTKMIDSVRIYYLEFDTISLGYYFNPWT